LATPEPKAKEAGAESGGSEAAKSTKIHEKAGSHDSVFFFSPRVGRINRGWTRMPLENFIHSLVILNLPC
jgi:hypothetical protein